MSLENSDCSYLNYNRTVIFTSAYDGIPQTILLNLIAWILLLLLFTLMRSQAFDYGRLALVNSGSINKRWTQLFYAHGNTNEEIVNSFGSNESRGESPLATPQVSTSQVNPNLNRQPSVIDKGFFAWIPVTWQLTKEQVHRHSGPDAVHYLSFQQHLIIVMGVICACSMIVVLPVNLQGTLNNGDGTFGQTTVSNISPESSWLWVHVIFAILFVPLVILIMRKSSGRNAGKVAATKTVMITNIRKPDCSKQKIQEYLNQIFPQVYVQSIELAYNIKELTEVATEYEAVIEARIYCEQHRGRDPILASPNCFTCQTVDALEYYKEQEQVLCGKVARMRSMALNDPLGIAFVTVNSTGSAQSMIVHFKPSSYRDWNVSFAPKPEDIYWENLTTSSASWYVRWIMVNLVLFLFLFFLTTPVIIINFIKTFPLAQNATEEIAKTSPLISEFLPTLLLWFLTAILPVTVAYSETWLSHWTKSRLNYAVMTKSFGYLLFMILILPSLGLTSAKTFIEWGIQANNQTTRFECIFLPDKGAFFVNYVITAAFIGTAMELIRLPELIVYMWRLCTAKSKAETSHIRKSILIEFPFGIHYAWQISIFTMATVYSLACPMITPFAVLYLLLKHFNDKHNLYFAYGPTSMVSQGGGKIHSTAVTMTKFSVVLLLMAMAALAYVRGRKVDARVIILIVTLVVSLTLFSFMSPIKRCTTRPPTIIEHYGPNLDVYVADVFLNQRIMGNSPAHISYGSSDSTADFTLEVDSSPNETHA